MARFMEIKSVIPKLRQDQKPKDLNYSSSTLQRFRHDIDKLSPYRIPPKIHKRGQLFQKQPSMMVRIVSMTSKDLKWLQMTSKDLKRLNPLNPTQTTTLLLTTQRIGKAN